MTSISGLGSSGNYATGAQSRLNATASNSVSLSTDTIDFALSGDAATVQASNANSLFSVLNANILDYNNLAGVGSAIDTYTKSLPNSNVYDSSYTAPSAKYLTELANLKTVAASGNRKEAESVLAAAKLDAPDNVAGGISTAISRGDTAGEAGLVVEGTANISDFLSTHGYSAAGARAEASAVTINGLAEYATNTPSSSAQTRIQQINDLALYAADNAGADQHGVPATSSNPLFNIISSLLDAKSGVAIDQSLTSLDILYGGSTSDTADNTA